MKNPLVTVVCLCYNQGAYVKDAIESILNQTYESIEIMVYDDCSTDNSLEVINELVNQHPQIKFLSSEENLGNCKAFNRALAEANGDFIIDLAADDVLNPERIEVGVAAMSDPKYGVHFSDACIVNESGQVIDPHERSALSRSGDLYIDLIRRYFINPASMMFRTSLMKKLEGYDESLTYEDYDIWIRTSRVSQYSYTNQPLVSKRVVSGSHGSGQKKLFNKHQNSTLAICKKISSLNENIAEKRALNERIRYEIRNCIRQLNWHLIPSFLKLYTR